MEDQNELNRRVLAVQFNKNAKRPKARVFAGSGNNHEKAERICEAQHWNTSVQTELRKGKTKIMES
jgi:hypothetical protein